MSATSSPRFRFAWVAKTFLITGTLTVLGMVIIPSSSCGCGPRESASRHVDSSNLRQIGQASLIYAADHQNSFPQTDSITDYAAELARGAGLNDGTIWVATAHQEAALAKGLATVLASDGKAIDSVFRQIRPDFAVVTRGLHANLPATTPIAWTRGLQADGTWSKDSPYGGDGGHIVFLGGNVSFYRKLTDASLVRFGDPTATTADIRQALPPDAKISEPLAQKSDH